MSSLFKKILVDNWISFSVIAFLIFGIIFFGFNISRFAEKLTKGRQDLAQRSASLQSLASLRTDYTDTAEAYLNVLHNVVPLKDELIDVSKDFQAIAAAGNLEYGFTFIGETPATADTLGFVKFNLALGGPLNELLNFVKSLENFRYLVNFENIAVSKNLETTRMAINGSVFFRQ